MTPADLVGLPGGDLVLRGLADAARGIDSDEALLVAIGAPRLARLGLAVPAWPPAATASAATPAPDAAAVPGAPELALYLRLARAEPRSAHSAYNALVRRLVSCERALELEAARRARAAAAGAERSDGGERGPRSE